MLFTYLRAAFSLSRSNYLHYFDECKSFKDYRILLNSEDQ